MILLLAADRQQARNLLRYVRGLLDAAPLAGMIQRETMDGFELSNGIDVFVGTGDYRTIRGRTILLAVFNETAFWRDETSANPDREIYRAVVPAMATLADEAMLIMISSVHRRAGLLFDGWQRYFGQDDPNTLVIWGTTKQFNPTISDQVIADALADDPASASAEFESRWRDDLASYVSRNDVEACLDRGVTIRPPEKGLQYSGFIDASSGRGDSFCAAVGHAEGDIALLDCIVEIRPPFDPADAVAEISKVLKSYGLGEVVGDRYALGFVASEFNRHGIVLRHGDKNRSELYRELLPSLRARRVRLLDHDRMVGQFVALERRPLAGGSERIDHPGGAKDDVSNVVAGCLVGLLQSADPYLLTFYKNQSDALDRQRAAQAAPPSSQQPEPGALRSNGRCKVRLVAACSHIITVSGEQVSVETNSDGAMFVWLSETDARAMLSPTPYNGELVADNAELRQLLGPNPPQPQGISIASILEAQRPQTRKEYFESVQRRRIDGAKEAIRMINARRTGGW